MKLHDFGYPHEKFSNAVDTLAGPAPLQTRLHHAWMSFHAIQPKDFTDLGHPEMQTAYEEIMTRLTKVRDADPEKGYVPATLERMTTEEATELSRMIVALAFDIAQARAREG